MLHKAACRGRMEIVQLLLDKNADIHAVDDVSVYRIYHSTISYHNSTFIDRLDSIVLCE